MSYETLFHEIRSLPDELVNEVEEYVMFLKFRADHRPDRNQSKVQAKRRGGTLAGKLKYIADDFNATPEGFEAYTISEDQAIRPYQEAVEGFRVIWK